MGLIINNLLITKIWEKVERLMRIKFESKPVYGDDEKYMKTKIKKYSEWLQIFITKNYLKKKHNTNFYQ